MKTKTIAVKTPDALARELGLSCIEAQEWQVQHALLERLRQIVRDEGLTHAGADKRAGSSRTRVTSILNENLDNISCHRLNMALRMISVDDWTTRYCAKAVKTREAMKINFGGSVLDMGCAYGCVSSRQVPAPAGKLHLALLP